MSQGGRQFFVDDNILLSFGDLDYSIYNTILRSQSELIDMRVADVAKSAGVSNASVVRFCKKCGYSGFPELKMAFVNQMRGQQKEGPLPSVTSDIKSFLEDGAHQEYVKRISEAYELLRWARGVLFLGYGHSAGLAVYGANLFCELGLLSIPITSFPSYLTSAPQQDGAAVVISNSGTTPMVLNATQELAAQGYSIISITGNPSGQIGRLSDVCISYRMPMRGQTGRQDLSTRMPALFAIEQLARMLYNESHA